jgi:pimeloyl-ACP methyl ester carboxylesterase
MVLLHAGVADRTMWSEHLEPFAEAGHRVVAIDLPGYGQAPVVAGEQAAWLDVLQTMAELSIERAALVGNSFGGAVAMRASWVAPERVSALVLVSVLPPLPEPSPRLNAAWEAEEAALESGGVDAAVRAIVEAWTLPDASPALRERLTEMNRVALARQTQGTETTEAPDPLEQAPGAIARIDIPALVAAGEHDMVDFRDGAEAMARAMPQARHLVIAGAGHLAPLETPQAFRELVLDFLG